MKREYVKKGLLCGILLTAVGLVATLSPVRTLAMDRIKLNEPCSLLLNAGSSYEADLKDSELTVKLYQVASVSEYTEFTPMQGFEDIGIPEKNGQLTAEDWQNVTKKAAEICGVPYEEEGTEESALEPTYEFQVKAAENEDRFITPQFDKKGLFLIAVEPVQTNYYEYTFLPSLVSIPNNLYFVVSEDQIGEGQEIKDEWIYENILINLKPQQNPRYAKLTIEKNLDTYNASLGPVTFVFEVTGTTPDGVLYSRVVSLVFGDEDGVSKSAVIDDIPAGTEVTVKEVYHGASYQLSEGSPGEYTITLNEEDGNGNIADEVVFHNDYNGGRSSGTSIVNHFETVDDGWEHSELKDNSGTGNQGE